MRRKSYVTKKLSQKTIKKTRKNARMFSSLEKSGKAQISPKMPRKRYCNMEYSCVCRGHYAGFLMFFKNEITVFRHTPNLRAIALMETFSSKSDCISSSCPESLSRSDFLPVGLPSTKPSDRLRASASFVLWEIRSRSISADNPKANARILA